MRNKGGHSMSRRSRLTLALPLILFSATGSSTPVVGAISELVVEESALGPASEGCASFVVTEDQARGFFERAVLISGRQEHDFFLHGPCSARGTFKSRFDTWRWEMRSLGTATITATNGDIFVLGDPEQASSPDEE